MKKLALVACVVLLFSCKNDDVAMPDMDKDGIADSIDNCVSTPNADQADSDGDGIGDVCDDGDNDGIFDATDNCLEVSNQDQRDTDGDGIGDVCDDDDDNDTILDEDDNCPLIANQDQADGDGDGIGDVCDGVSNSRIPCENGMAGNYPCNDYDLMSRISLTQMNAGAGNDSWGWTDPTTAKEYAIMGLDNGTAFIDISEPLFPVYLGKLPTATSSSTWRDVKVYQNYAFIVSEASGHGMQVFDLTKLRNVSAPPVTFTADTRFTGFGNAHNIVINESTGYAYPVGTSLNQGGPLFINIQDPLNPISEGGYATNEYSHDAQVVTYNGPDADYVGREILIGSNGEQNGVNEVVIVDVTDKANPQLISSTSYSNAGYTHQGWFTEDQQYFLVGDELDELRFGFDTRTLVFDFTDLDAPVKLYDYLGPTAAIDHNGYINNNVFYLANYTAGVRFIDVTNVSTSLNEIGFFDTFPSNNNASFNGVWNVYPFFESGNIIISDSSGGLFIVRKSGT